MLSRGSNNRFSPAQGEVVTLLKKLNIEIQGTLEARIKTLRGETAKEVWDALAILPDPYCSVMFKAVTGKSHQNIESEGVVSLEQIGSGGNGNVYAGWQWESRKPVAIKQLLYSTDGRQERKIMSVLDNATLPSEPISPRLISTERWNDPSIIMNFSDGVSEQHLIEVRKQNALLASAGYAAQALSSIAHLLYRMHLLRVMHLDLKPANILVAVRDNVRTVCDYGAARIIKDPESNSVEETLVGTACYFSPERCEGIVQSFSDVYAFGITAFEMITNELPFTTHQDLQTRDLGPLRKERARGISDQKKNLLRKKVPLFVVNCILSALNPDASKRPSLLDMRNIFTRWHLGMNRNLLRDKHKNEAKSPESYFSLSPAIRSQAFSIFRDKEPQPNPLSSYRIGKSTLHLDTTKIVAAQNQIFGQVPKKISYFTQNNQEESTRVLNVKKGKPV